MEKKNKKIGLIEKTVTCTETQKRAPIFDTSKYTKNVFREIRVLLSDEQKNGNKRDREKTE